MLMAEIRGGWPDCLEMTRGQQETQAISCNGRGAREWRPWTHGRWCYGSRTSRWVPLLRTPRVLFTPAHRNWGKNWRVWNFARTDFCCGSGLIHPSFYRQLRTPAVGVTVRGMFFLEHFEPFSTDRAWFKLHGLPEDRSRPRLSLLRPPSTNACRWLATSCRTRSSNRSPSTGKCQSLSFHSPANGAHFPSASPRGHSCLRFHLSCRHPPVLTFPPCAMLSYFNLGLGI